MTAKRSAGFLLLAATCGLLYFYSLKEAFTGGAVLTAILAAASAALLYGFYLETPIIKAPSQGHVFPAKDLSLFLAVVVGALISFWLNINMGLGAVVAAALVGVVAQVVAPAYAVPLYCGSFVGMASPRVLDSAQFALAAAIAGIIYVLAQDVFNGFGGKLGTIACAGCCLGAVFSRKTFLSSGIPGWDVGQKIILTSVIAAVVAYYINVRMGKGAVFGSAIVGLVGGLVLPSLFPEVGGTLATVCICASFAGMSSKARISNEGLMAVAGVIAGLVFMFSSPHLGGAGGKLGTTAFGSVIAVSAAHKFFQKLSPRKS